MCSKCCSHVCDNCLNHAMHDTTCLGQDIGSHTYFPMPCENPDAKDLPGFDQICTAKLLAHIIAERVHMSSNAGIKIDPHTVLLQIFMCLHHVPRDSNGKLGLWPMSMTDLIARIHSRGEYFHIPCKHEEVTVKVQIQCSDFHAMWRGDPHSMQDCSISDARKAALLIEKMLIEGDSCAAAVWVPHPLVTVNNSEGYKILLAKEMFFFPESGP